MDNQGLSNDDKKRGALIAAKFLFGAIFDSDSDSGSSEDELLFRQPGRLSIFLPSSTLIFLRVFLFLGDNGKNTKASKTNNNSKQIKF